MSAAGSSIEAPPLRPALDALFWPLTRERFMAEVWDRRAFVSHGPASRLASLEVQLSSFDLPVVARRARLITVLHDDQKDHYRSGSAEFDALDLNEMLRAGRTLYLRELEGVDSWIAGLADELGVRRNGEVAAFASATGTTTPLHFDAQEVFTVQLRGHKRWRVAANRQVAHPTVGQFAREPGSSYLRQYVPGRMPSRLSDEEATTIDMVPGSVLYLPNGYWHETETFEDSISLLITLQLVTWGDLVLDGLQAAMLKDLVLRERAVGAWGDDGSRALAQAKLGEALAAVASRLEGLKAEDLVETEDSVVGPATDYRRNPVAGYGIEDDDGVTVTATFVRRPTLSLRSFKRDIPVAALELLAWLDSQATTFTLAEAEQHAGGLTPDALAAMLDVLVEVGFLRPSSTTTRAP